MMWGDVGILYWLIRFDDLANRNFEASSSPGSAPDPAGLLP